MSNYTGKPALYLDPKITLEVLEKLKATTPKEFRAEQVTAAFGALTERDLLFYCLGKSDGLKTAEELPGKEDAHE